MQFPLIENYRALSAERRAQIRVTVLVAAFFAAVAATLVSAIPEESQRMPDFTGFDSIAERKSAFINYISPIVERQNQAILETRERLQDICGRFDRFGRLSRGERRWLRELSGEYRVYREDLDRHEICEKLLRRVDVLPVALVVVQAAKESGWGRSKFAREGNNLFGEWCYTRGCGIVPGRRRTGDRHEVRRFAAVADSVASYMRNLNTHPRYRMLREIRADYRRKGETVTALALAEGLKFYSQRREAYVQEVQSMIRQFHRFRSSMEL